MGGFRENKYAHTVESVGRNATVCFFKRRLIRDGLHGELCELQP